MKKAFLSAMKPYGFRMKKTSKKPSLNLLFSGFAEGETWRFTHTSEIGMNETCVFCKCLYEKTEDILPIPTALAKHLYERSDRPQVKPGEFMVALLENWFYQNQICKSISSIRIEHKDLFMRLRQVG